MLEFDFFKQFNDTYGHPAGDRCITMIAAALNRAVRRASDLTARYSGEEFAWVLPGTGADAAMDAAKNIHAQIRSLAIPHSGSISSPWVTVSLGVTTARCVPGMQADPSIAHPDRQLYLSKTRSRNRSVAHGFSTDTGRAVRTPARLQGGPQSGAYRKRAAVIAATTRLTREPAALFLALGRALQNGASRH